jgi:hypothetical protein
MCSCFIVISPLAEGIAAAWCDVKPADDALTVIWLLSLDAARGADERGGEGAREQGLQLQPDPGHGLHGVAAAEHAGSACRRRRPVI